MNNAELIKALRQRSEAKESELTFAWLYETQGAMSQAADAPRAEIPTETKPVKDLPMIEVDTKNDGVSVSETPTDMSFTFVVTDCSTEQFEQLVAFLEGGGYTYAMEV